MDALYRKAYGTGEHDPTAPAPRPASPARDARGQYAAAPLESVPTLRAEQSKHSEGSPRYIEIQQQIENAFRAAYPEPVSQDPEPSPSRAESPSTTTGDETAPPLTDEDHHAAWRATATTSRHDGQPWNGDTLAQVHSLMRVHLSAADRDELFSFVLPILNAAHAEIAGGVEVSPEGTEALLKEEWDDEWGRKSSAADAVWAKLPRAE